MSIDIRDLRCFLAVVSELHFARAEQKLHIEKLPLSRTIRELEEELGVQLFVRATRLTRAGELFLEYAHRVLAALGQAQDSARAAAHGYYGQMRLVVSDVVPQSNLAALLALSRQEKPEVSIRLFRVPLAQQVKRLREDQYDMGLAQADQPGDGLLSEFVWSDPLCVAVPARHPLLAYQRIPLQELLRYPLVLVDALVWEGHAAQIAHVLRHGEQEPLVAEKVDSFDSLMVLVAMGIALALTSESMITGSQQVDVVARPLAGRALMLQTYVLRRDVQPVQALARFIERVHAVDLTCRPGGARRPVRRRQMRSREGCTASLNKFKKYEEAGSATVREY